MKRFSCISVVTSAIQLVACSAQPPEPAIPAPVSDADYHDDGAPRFEKVELGRMLFFDKLLSGNRNISCATCHHPSFAGGDGVALPLGEGPQGLGPDREPSGSLAYAVHGRVPRNSPALFNLGAREFERLFHDGRVELDATSDYAGGIITPARWKLPAGLDNVLAAQAMFPIASPAEMAGNPGENDIADAVFAANVAGPGGVWALLGERLRENAQYVALFERAYPEQVHGAEDVTYVLAANAIAAFETTAFRSDGSPFDRHLRGEPTSMSAGAKRGMALFYREGGCSGCHAGKFQTDHDFHAIAMPQIGPGKGDGHDGGYWRTTGLKLALEDYGRGRVTHRAEDRYKFRTPSLRNVALTAPYGHAGAYPSLEAVVRHHLDPVKALGEYRLPPELLPPLGAVLEVTAHGSSLSQRPLRGERRNGYESSDSWVQQSDVLRGKIAAANELEPRPLDEPEVRDLIAFLESLTDPETAALDALVPATVPSGLPVSD